MKKAIVLGATGLIGRSLVSKLASDPTTSEVISITRRPVEYDSTKITNEVVNFEQLVDHSDIFRGDLLFSCLGTTLKTAKTIEAQRKVDVDYQLQAAQLASQNGVKHYLLVSSNGADANSRNQYLRMKGDLQGDVRKLPFEKLSIFQPSLLYGDRTEFRTGERLGFWLLKFLNAIGLLRKHKAISGDEVAEKMIQVSKSQSASEQTYAREEVFPD